MGARAQYRLDLDKKDSSLVGRVISPKGLEPKTKEWLEASIGFARKLISFSKTDCIPLADICSELKEHQAWEMYFQDEPKTWERFCSEVFNEKFAIAAYLDKIIDAVRELQADGATTVPLTTAEKAIGLASVAVAPGPDGRPKKLTQRVRLSTGSNDRRVAQIAKRRPDILEDMKAGKYPSVRQAAIAAGIVRVPTPLEVALKAYNKLSDSDKAQFHRQIGAPI